MKKICILLAVIVLFSPIPCSNRPAKIDYGESDLYTMDEREIVANMIIEHFVQATFFQNQLYTLDFAGDSICSSQLAMYNRQEDKEYEECLVYIAHYSTPEAIKYFNQPERTTCFFYVKEPGGEWYLKGIGW